MKLKINKRLKIALISLFTIILIGCSYLTYHELNNPKFAEQKTKVYSYDNKGYISYEVFLNPNKLYEKDYLEEGMVYITEYVNNIKANLGYEFNGERSAEITGNYNITAKVKGFISERDNTIPVWEKDFPIISNRGFKSNDSTISISENVNLELEYYNEFAKEIIETSKIKCDTSLNLIMSINLNANTDKGPIEENISTDLIIPLNVLMFEIGGNNNIEKQGAIEETIQVQLPLNKTKIILFGIIIGILSIALIYLIFFTILTTAKDPLDKEINKIFKKHGDRLVALNDYIEIGNSYISHVKSIDDLVRIADEVEKPILYKYSENYKEINKFYIVLGDKMFIFDLSELISKEDIVEEDSTEVPVG